MSVDPLADFDREIVDFLESAGIAPEFVQLQTPAQRDFGERSTNAAMRLARERGKAPQEIAAEIAASFDSSKYRFIEAVELAGKGFINFRLNYEHFVPHVIRAVREAGDEYGKLTDREPRRVIVEHTSVNPNKEWHIGHVRNAALGDVVVRLLRLSGDEVEVQNYIDDTGPQAAQSVAAMLDFPEAVRGDEKFDQYAGRGYVKIAAEINAERELLRSLEPEAGGNLTRDQVFSIESRLSNTRRLQKRILEVMHQLEEGDHAEITGAILDAQLQTAYRLGVFYDLLNWESHLIQSRIFDEAMQRLRRSEKVYRAKEGRYEGAMVIETGGEPATGEERKAEVLIRSNGLPTYVGKDIAYHMWKFRLIPDRLFYVAHATQPNGEILWTTALAGETRNMPPPDLVVNVIGVHQAQAQDAVKQGLRAAGFDQAADSLVHLDYGLVSTKEGKISGRKGTTVSGDAVIEQAIAVALERVREKRSQDLTDAEMEEIAGAVGIGAVRYFMVQYNPLRDIVFDVADVVSYDGNTGLYVQYAVVRMFAILRRAREEHEITREDIDAADVTLLVHEQEKRLMFQIAQFPGVVETSSRTLAVNLLAEYAFDLATIFNQFYRDCGVLNAELPLRAARLHLVRTVRDALVQACGVLGVPVVERL
jgi:arginyl-tRNA synthetase